MSDTQLSMWLGCKKRHLCGFFWQSTWASTAKNSYSNQWKRALAAAAKLWNSIPVAIRLCKIVTTFKICIQTYLFNLAYPITEWFYQTRNISCWQILVVQCSSYVYFYPMNFILCVLFIVHCFWLLHKSAK